MKLNGWLRLYVVIVALWTLLVSAIIFVNFPEERLFSARASGNQTEIAEALQVRADWLKTMAVLWALPSLGLLVVGYGAAWVIQGFHGSTR